MKVITNHQSFNTIMAFLDGFFTDEKALFLMSCEETEPVYADCDAAELQNIIAEITRAGQVNAAKQIFQGNIFYRSDTAKCKRCQRFRPEIYYDLQRGVETGCCNRCADTINGGQS